MDYILERVVQLGVRSIFGVPGDFNLVALDSIEAHPSLDWVANANEYVSSKHVNQRTAEGEVSLRRTER